MIYPVMPLHPKTEYIKMLPNLDEFINRYQTVLHNNNNKTLTSWLV